MRLVYYIYKMFVFSFFSTFFELKFLQVAKTRVNLITVITFLTIKFYVLLCSVIKKV